MININGVNATFGRDGILIKICFLPSSKIQNCFQIGNFFIYHDSCILYKNPVKTPIILF